MPYNLELRITLNNSHSYCVWTFGWETFSLVFSLFGSLAIWQKTPALSPNCTCNWVNIKPHQVKTSIWFLIVFMLEIWKSMETWKTSKLVCEAVHSDLRSVTASCFKATHSSMHDVACKEKIKQYRYRLPALGKSWWYADKVQSFCNHRLSAAVLHIAS